MSGTISAPSGNGCTRFPQQEMTVAAAGNDDVSMVAKAQWVQVMILSGDSGY